MTVWVKVCGLRTVADVVVAVGAGADAIGLMLADSPRRISIERATELARAAGSVDSVLVTVDMPVGEVEASIEKTGATGVQPYGAHAGEVIHWAHERGLFVLQPVAVGSGPIGDLAIQPGSVPLLDTALPHQHGGGGRTFDWDLTRDYPERFVLAGGLNPENVRDALVATKAWGVDASSGLESALGTKDHVKIRAFIEGAKGP